MTTIDDAIDQVIEEITEANEGASILGNTVEDFIEWLEWNPADLECPECHVDNQVACGTCGRAPMKCDCARLPETWYCFTCTTEWEREVFVWAVEDVEITPVEDTEPVVVVELKCTCSPQKTYKCELCGVERNLKTDPWKKVNKVGAKITSMTAAPKASTVGTTYYTHKCRHYEFPVVFPDGTIVHATSKIDRDDKAHRPDLGLYLDSSWSPACVAYYLKWQDYGLPAWDDVAIQTIQICLDAARAGKFVEIGCIGGHGRTGTVLAAMATVCGVAPDQAVKWVKDNYCKEAVETEQQEWWPEFFHATINGYAPRPKPVYKAKSGGSQATTHFMVDHYVMLMLGMTCGCTFWAQDVSNMAIGKLDEIKPDLTTINKNLAPVIKWRAANDSKEKLSDAQVKQVAEGTYLCHCGKPFTGTGCCKCTNKADGSKCNKCDPSNESQPSILDLWTSGSVECHCGKPYSGEGKCACDYFSKAKCTIYPTCLLKPGSFTEMLTEEAKAVLATAEPVAEEPTTEDYSDAAMLEKIKVLAAALPKDVKKKTEKGKTQTTPMTGQNNGSLSEDTSKTTKAFCEICCMAQNHTDGHDWFHNKNLALTDGPRILASGELHVMGWPMVDAFMSMFFGPGWSYWSEEPDDRFLNKALNNLTTEPFDTSTEEPASEPRRRGHSTDVRCIVPGCNEWMVLHSAKCSRCHLVYPDKWWTDICATIRSELDPPVGTVVGLWKFDGYTLGWTPVESDGGSVTVKAGLIEVRPKVWTAPEYVTFEDWQKILEAKDWRKIPKESSTIS
jgi:hypothetical protein